MKNSKIGILAMAVCFIALLASCSKDDTIIDRTEDQIRSVEQPSQDYLKENAHPVLFNQDISGLSEAQISNLYFNASKADQLLYKRNGLIVELYMELGLLDEGGPLYQKSNIYENLDYWNYIDENEQRELESRFKQVVGNSLRAQCKWELVGVITGGPPPVVIYIQKFICSSNTIVLYEGNNGQRKVIGVIDANLNKRVLFQNGGCSDYPDYTCPNDEARSMRMWHMKERQMISLFDHPDAEPNADDYVEITVRQDFDEYLIPTFEEDVTNDFIHQDYFPKNGLDGKVSSVKIEGNQ